MEMNPPSVKPANESFRNVRVNLSENESRPRYFCPNGHLDWGAHPDDDTNYCLCHACKRLAERGWELFHIHKYITDEKTGESVPWGLVTIEPEK